MLAANGKPLAEIYSPDGLHMNDLGYPLFRDAVRPVLLNGEGEFERPQAGPLYASATPSVNRHLSLRIQFPSR